MKSRPYLRTTEGATYHADLDEALQQFASERGYRITFELDDGRMIVIRRSSEGEPGLLEGDTVYAAEITVRVMREGEVRVRDTGEVRVREQ